MASPDFINSEYCYSKEMNEALSRHKSGDMRILPVIVEPCEWQKSPLGKLLAVPTDGKAISNYTNHNNAFLDVTQAVRKIVSTEATEHVSEEQGNGNQGVYNTPETVTRYRSKKTFDEFDKAEFRDKAFSEIYEYFKAALTEIGSLDGIRARFDPFENSAFTATISNQNISKIAHITVRSGGGNFQNDISFAHGERVQNGTSNGSFSVTSSDYELMLGPIVFGLYTHQNEKLLTPLAAAELIWKELIDNAEIDYG
jgi:hypothetical protein